MASKKLARRSLVAIQLRNATVLSPSREDIRSLETRCREPRTHPCRHRGALREMRVVAKTAGVGDLADRLAEAIGVLTARGR
jgi:hypothetical protein